jgi:hypothetical protein
MRSCVFPLYNVHLPVATAGVDAQLCEGNRRCDHRPERAQLPQKGNSSDQSCTYDNKRSLNPAAPCAHPSAALVSLDSLVLQ